MSHLNCVSASSVVGLRRRSSARLSFDKFDKVPRGSLEVHVTWARGLEGEQGLPFEFDRLILHYPALSPISGPEPCSQWLPFVRGLGCQEWGI